MWASGSDAGAGNVRKPEVGALDTGGSPGVGTNEMSVLVLWPARANGTIRTVYLPAFGGTWITSGSNDDAEEPTSAPLESSRYTSKSAAVVGHDTLTFRLFFVP